MTRLLLVALIAAAVCMVSAGVGAVETAWVVDDDAGMDRILKMNKTLAFGQVHEINTVRELSMPPVVYSNCTSTPPTIDGLLIPNEWGSPEIVKTLNYINRDTSESETHEMTVHFMNDDTYLYIAIKITNEDFESDDVQGVDVDVIELYFDNDNDGVIEPNEDIKNFWNLEYGDWFYKGNGTWCSDSKKDGGGAAKHSNHAIGDYTYEFRIPLNSSDDQDLSVTPDCTIGVKILYREMCYSSADGYWYGVGKDGWPTEGERFDGSTYGKLVLSSTNQTTELKIVSPANGTTVTTPSIMVTGTASDPSGIESVTVNGALATNETPDWSTWSAEVTLAEGENTITVVATNNTGGSMTETLTVWYEILRGDANHDGALTPADATITLQMAVRGEWSDEVDMNNDGKITSLDALIILQVAGNAHPPPGTEISYDDGSAEGGWSMGYNPMKCTPDSDGGKNGYALRMTTPNSEPFTISAIKVFSMRYGEDCKTRFEIWDCDKNTLYSDIVPHSEYSVPGPWDCDVWDYATWGYKDVPDVAVSGDFYIVMYTDSTNPGDDIYPDTGVYVCYDRSYSSDRAYVVWDNVFDWGEKTLTWDLSTPQETTNWMIRVVGMEVAQIRQHHHPHNHSRRHSL